MRRKSKSTRKEIIDSLTDDSPGIAPPMSLSAPELGSIDLERTMLRPWVSSTELLHEKAMARFYQAVAEEEQQSSLKRRFSMERRSSRAREIINFGQASQSFNDDENSVAENTKRRSSKSSDSEKNLQISQETSKFDNIDNTVRGSLKTDGDKTQLYQRYTEKYDTGVQEGMEEGGDELSEVEDEEEYSEESVEEEEEEEGGFEMEEEEYDEEELEEEEELDDMDMLGGSEIGVDERPPYSVEEETYHPRNMTPRSGTFTALSSRSSKNDQKPSKVLDDLQDPTNVTAVVSHSIRIPVKATLKPPEIVRPTVRIEVTPPPDEAPKRNPYEEPTQTHVIKPIIKKTVSNKDKELSPSDSRLGIKESPQKSPSPNRHYSPPKLTPDGRHIPNLNAPLPKPILKIRESRDSQEQTIDTATRNDSKTAPLAAVEPELNLETQREKMVEMNRNLDKSDECIDVTGDGQKLKKKQVRIEVPIDRRSYDADEDFSVSLAGDVARNRRRSRSNSLLDAASDPTKCVIHHYSDIVKEFGRVRKVPTTLYLNYEDLKAAAQTSDAKDPIVESEAKEEEVNEEQNRIDEDKKSVKVEDEKKFEFIMESMEMQRLPQMILLSDVPVDEPIDQEEPDEDPESNQDYVDYTYNKEEEMDVEYEPVVRNKVELKTSKSAEKRVRSAVEYMTDVAMFIVACYLYVFSDERLAIPILILMIYRQAKEATVSYIKRQIAKLPKMPRLPWRRGQ